MGGSFMGAFCAVDTPAGAAMARRYDERRGEVTPPYGRSPATLFVGRDDLIAP